MFTANYTPFGDELVVTLDHDTALEIHGNLVQAPGASAAALRLMSILERFIAKGDLSEYDRQPVGHRAPDGERPIEDFGPYDPVGDGYAPGDPKGLPSDAGRW
jgi:hypothetical protein